MAESRFEVPTSTAQRTRGDWASIVHAWACGREADGSCAMSCRCWCHLDPMYARPKSGKVSSTTKERS